MGGTSVGGPSSQTGENHFAVLAFDSINWLIDGFENRPSSGGGAPIQVFCNTHSGISSSPGVMTGVINLGCWDKLIYQYIDGAIVVGCYSLNVSTNGSRQSIRTGGRTRVSNNIVQGGIHVVGPNGANVSDNYIWDFDHIGIAFGPVGAIGTAYCRDIYCGGNTIIAATPGGSITEIYEGIRVESGLLSGTDVQRVNLGPNTIINADMVAASSGGASAGLGAIRPA